MTKLKIPATVRMQSAGVVKVKKTRVSRKMREATARADEQAINKFVQDSVRGVFDKHIRDSYLRELQEAGPNPHVLAETVQTALGVHQRTFGFDEGHRYSSFGAAFKAASHHIRDSLTADLKEYKTFKMRPNAYVQYVKYPPGFDNTKKMAEAYQEVWISPTTDEDIYIRSASSITAALERLPYVFTETATHKALNSSGFVIDEIQELRYTAIQLPVHKVGAYIPTPTELKHKRASIVNIEHNDEECCRRAIVAGVAFERVHASLNGAQINRWNQYAGYEHELNFTGITYPTPLEYLDMFEDLNNISVTVLKYDCEDKDLYHLRETKYKEAPIHLNLMLLESGDKQHFTYVHDLSALLSKYVTKHNGAVGFCRHCNQHSAKDKTGSHVCVKMLNGPLEVLPDAEHDIIRFRNWRNQDFKGYVMYADFECSLVPNGDKQAHVANSFGLYALNNRDGYQYVHHVGEDSVAVFMKTVKSLALELYRIKAKIEPMRMTDEQKEQHEAAEVCYICDEAFGERGRRKVRDHNHETGEYLGAAHSTPCNIHRNDSHFNVDVFFHNFKGYDSHLLWAYGNPAQFGCEDVFDGDISCIPDTVEKYKCVFWKPKYEAASDKHYAPNIRIAFKDSQPFFGPNASLATLVQQRKKSGLKFPNLSAALESKDKQQHYDMVLRKGIYPYNYIDSVDRLKETCLPPREAFYNNMNNTECSVEEYEHAQHVWRALECRTFEDYHLFYLMSDVMLLADVFEGFRDMFMSAFKLDPAYYVGLPSAVWDAFLKKSGVELQLITNDEQFAFVERAKRGGISMISNRYARSNNRHMKAYDSSQPSSYLMYEDANSLYPTVMTMALPVGRYVWNVAFTLEQIMKWDDDCEWGAFVEVDTEYPAELHDLHNDYPIQESKMSPTDEQVSPLTRAQRKELNIKDNVPKLVPNLFNKQNNVCHISRAKFWAEHGIKITKIHKALVFEQRRFMKGYVDYCAEMRRKANKDAKAEKDFWKLCMNSIFGKTIEDVRKRCNFRMVTDLKKMRKLSNKGIKEVRIFSNEMAGVMLQKTKVYMNKPIAIGVTILDRSKVHMGEFYYDYLKPKYGADIKMLATDTDSFIYQVKTDDIYEDMARNPEWFDLSVYKEDHPLHHKDNAGVLGKFKDEAEGLIISEFVGLKPKVYSFIVDEESIPDKTIGKRVAKGVPKSSTVVGTDKKVSHENMRDVLLNGNMIRVESMQFRSTNHNIRTVREAKKAMDNYDSKRWHVEGTHDTRALGHYKNID